MDLWLKASPELVVDSFYYREHVLGLPYHINYGKGLDCYKVGHTCGAGGLVAMIDDDPSDKIYVGGAYDRWQILEQTPEKIVFKLEYDSFEINGHVLQESITITAEAGKMLNRADVVLSGEYAYEGTLWLGGGICIHDSVENVYTCDHCGIAAYAEDALSDKTAAKMNYDYNGSTSQGRNYIAVVIPNGASTNIQDGILYAVRPYNIGDTLTYFFGACWSEWSNGEQKFATDQDWFDAIQL